MPTRRHFLAGGLAVALSPLLPAYLDRALRVGGPVALLGYFGLEEPVRVWSRTGTLRYGGYEWQGVGALGRIKPPALNTRLGIKQICYELRGVPAPRYSDPNTPVHDFLGKKVRNIETQIFLAAVRDGHVYGEPFLLFEALGDRLELEVKDSGQAVLSLYATLGLVSPERTTNRAWTDEAQKDRHPDDTGFSLVDQLSLKEIRWRVS